MRQFACDNYEVGLGLVTYAVVPANDFMCLSEACSRAQ